MNTLQSTLNEYYSKRAAEYEKVYHRPDPIRLGEQALIGNYITESFKNRSVLELACGTGYWTQYLIGYASTVTALDYSSDMTAIAKKRFARVRSVLVIQGDAYNPPSATPAFTGAMANFWFSHIPKASISLFLKTLHSRLAPNAVVLFADDVFDKKRGGTLIKKPGSLDTYKQRTLENGEKFNILKNYYQNEELQDVFTPYAKKLHVQILTNFWLARYTVA